MSLAKKIASSTFSQVFAKFAIAGLSVISVKLITKYLGTAGYGKYTVIYELMSFSGIIADFGLFHIALREMGKAKEFMGKILSNVLSIRFLFSFLSAILTLSIVFFGTNYELETIKLGLIIALGTSTIGLMGTTITAIIQVELKMVYAAAFQIIGKIATIGYLWYAISYDLGFLHMLYAGLFGTIVILIPTYLYSRKFSFISFEFDLKVWKKLLKETYPMALALVFYTFSLRAPVVMLDRIIKDSSLTGQYGVAQRITEILIFIPIAFMNSVLPTISKYAQEKYETIKDKLNKLIQHSFDFLNTISFCLIFLIHALSPEIITIISEKEFAKSSHILSILVYMIFFYYLSTLFGYILLAYHQQKYYMISNLYAAIFTLIFGIFGTKLFMEYGAVSSHIIGEIAAMFFTFYFLKKKLKLSLSFQYFPRMLLSAVLGFLSLYFLKPFFIDMHIILRLMILGTLGTSVYIFSLFILKGLPFHEIKNIVLNKK